MQVCRLTLTPAPFHFLGFCFSICKNGNMLITLPVSVVLRIKTKHVEQCLAHSRCEVSPITVTAIRIFWVGQKIHSRFSVTLKNLNERFLQPEIDTELSLFFIYSCTKSYAVIISAPKALHSLSFPLLECKSVD